MKLCKKGLHDLDDPAIAYTDPSSGNRCCRVCARERKRAYAEANREETREYQRKWREANPDRMRAKAQRWREANPEAIREGNHKRYEANKERIKERARKRYAADRERAKERSQRWRAANKERNAEVNRKRYVANREEIRESNRKRREVNLEERREANREWSKANPEKVREYQHRRRTQLGGSPSPEVVAHYKAIKDNPCYWCGQDTGPMHYDHIIPVNRGGPNSVANIVRACRGCNLDRGDKLPTIEWKVKRILIGEQRREVA